MELKKTNRSFLLLSMLIACAGTSQPACAGKIAERAKAFVRKKWDWTKQNRHAAYAIGGAILLCAVSVTPAGRRAWRNTCNSTRNLFKPISTSQAASDGITKHDTPVGNQVKSTPNEIPRDFTMTHHADWKGV